MQRHYGAGDIIIRREEIAPFLFRIENGKVRFEIRGHVWFLSGGDCFGEEGVFLGKPASYTALAAEETTAILLSRDEAASFFAENLPSSLLIIHRTVANLHEATAPLSPGNYHYLRLLKVLLPYAQQGGDSLSFAPVPFDVAHLANLLGTMPETVRRLLTEAASFGDVSVTEEGTILVRGADHLRRRITEARYTSFFESTPRKPYGRGRYNLLSRIT